MVESARVSQLQQLKICHKMLHSLSMIHTYIHALQNFTDNLTTKQCILFKAFSNRCGIEFSIIGHTLEQHPQDSQNPDPRGLSWCICTKCHTYIHISTYIPCHLQ